MTPHILTHNYYAIASLITLTIGSSYICSQIHNSWLSQFKFSLMDTNALIKFLIVVFGFSVISWHPLFDVSSKIQVVGMLLGVIIGFIFSEIEVYILKYSHVTQYVRTFPHKKPQGLIKKSLSRIKLTEGNYNSVSYNSVLIIGACEEILYRGFLTIVCLDLLSFYPSIFFLFLTTMLFALSHLSLGSLHVLSKFILGFICLVLFALTKTILFPIFIHVTFNIIAINKFRKVAYG